MVGHMITRQYCFEEVVHAGQRQLPEACKQTDKQTDGGTNRQIDTQTEEQMDIHRRADRQTDTDVQTDTGRQQTSSVLHIEKERAHLTAFSCLGSMLLMLLSNS